MTPDVKDWMKGLVQQLVDAPSCCGELKEVAQEWLEKCDTDELTDMTKKLIARLKLDVCTPQQTAVFFGTTTAKHMFGEEKAAAMQKHAEERTAAGEPYCDCAACEPGGVLLIHEDFLLK